MYPQNNNKKREKKLTHVYATKGYTVSKIPMYYGSVQFRGD
jgi:hypothetical protein